MKQNTHKKEILDSFISIKFQYLSSRPQGRLDRIEKGTSAFLLCRGISWEEIVIKIEIKMVMEIMIKKDKIKGIGMEMETLLEKEIFCLCFK